MGEAQLELVDGTLVQHWLDDVPYDEEGGQIDHVMVENRMDDVSVVVLWYEPLWDDVAEH